MRRVRDLELSTRRLVAGGAAGGHLSIFRGQGSEFAEIREYHYGDDVRSIDWKVTARFDRPYVKEFVEERDERVFFALDVSGSGAFGSESAKSETALHAVAALALAAVRGGDAVGVFMMTDRIEARVPAGKGRRHALAALSRIVSAEPASARTDLRACLESVSRSIRGRCTLVVVSDFADEGGYMRPMRSLARRHDVIALQVADPRESEMPDVGLIELEDAETGEQVLVDTSDEQFRAEYAREAARRGERLARGLARYRIDHAVLRTDADWAPPLRFLIARRRARR